jgi:hypothetical protein
MIRILAAAVVSVVMLTPAYAEEDKAKTWCTDAHMQEMEASIAEMSDPDKQKEAQSHLALSKNAMQAKDMKGCVEHMEEAHKAMGL